MITQYNIKIYHIIYYIIFIMYYNFHRDFRLIWLNPIQHFLDKTICTYDQIAFSRKTRITFVTINISLLYIPTAHNENIYRYTAPEWITRAREYIVYHNTAYIKNKWIKISVILVSGVLRAFNLKSHSSTRDKKR